MYPRQIPPETQRAHQPAYRHCLQPAVRLSSTWLERGADAKMARTQDRAILAGVPLRSTLIYGITLSLSGTALLTPGQTYRGCLPQRRSRPTSSSHFMKQLTT